ncbi:MAG: 1-deoxy-D-xylulose-5-phosphate reductoisomerase [Gemmatimonadetes bacterium]|nr:1-deoxy-D-xylulose-5-phosphate reductoisomerase [Gemmatimonadota bacterium]
MKKIVILGCTGSIGDSCFKVLQELGEDYQVLGLSAGNKVDKLLRLARVWKPEWVCVEAEDQLPRVRQELPGTQVVAGANGLLELAGLADADIVLNALVGAIGLEPTLAAIEAGKLVAMANKEPLVMAGGLILDQAASKRTTILPLDSEPNAMWQCLKGEERAEVRRLILTASGGPFFGRTLAQMGDITPAQALNHPTWEMGAKITVDSATLMNKGFEVIEASWLFGVNIDQVEVVIHRESIVHSLVEFADATMLAHLGKTDMILPIQYALTHPQRRASPLQGLDLAQVARLSFAAPDRENFPCLELCYEAGRRGGVAPAVLNAANEVAVAAFLGGEIGFLDIAAINRFALDSCSPAPADSLAAVRAADVSGRQWARQWIGRR